MSGTAIFLRRLSGYNGDARLYLCDPPMTGNDWRDDKPKRFKYVVVSAAYVDYSGPETYIFGADEQGNVIDWGELHGSFRGGLDHAEALEGAGYTIGDGDVIEGEIVTREIEQ